MSAIQRGHGELDVLRLRRHELLDGLLDRIPVNPRESHLHLFREILPVFPVIHCTVVEWLYPGERLGHDLVQWQADEVDEADLHLRQFVSTLAVHHRHRLLIKLQPLQVALVEELVGHELGHAVLDLPGFGDRANVARRHHHAA